MADANQKLFSSRLKRIDRQHRKLSRGYVQLVERDGMLVPMPRRRVRTGFPFRGLLIAIVGILLFKGVLLASLGEGTYQFRVEKIAEGSSFEKVAAWVMQADPVTRWIAGQLAPFL